VYLETHCTVGSKRAFPTGVLDSCGDDDVTCKVRVVWRQMICRHQHCWRNRRCERQTLHSRMLPAER